MQGSHLLQCVRAFTDLVLTLLQFEGELFEDVATTAVNCSVMEGVECAGDRSFTKTDVPCVKLVYSCVCDVYDSYLPPGTEVTISPLYSSTPCSWVFLVSTASALATHALVLQSY